MPASGFCVLVPVTLGCTGAAAAGGGKFENLKKKCNFFQNEFYIHFVPTALSCALPAF
ncbi:unnamed protein product [Staurois parvus]|uniref:Secreted protein n=1 Tax=Staurois parvus TaxID=386267 RepID=A0ABN9G5W3_9NEOB|nr:unnamed protein product [Staurois parvus]